MTPQRLYLHAVLLGAALLFSSAFSNGSHASADAQLLIDVLRDVHPGYLRYQSDAEAAMAEQTFLEAAARATDDGSFYLATSAYLATLRCEHTEAELPVALAQWRDTTPSMLPVAYTWVEGTAIVVGVAPGTTGVGIGDELLEVDGHGMASLFEQMAPHISVDGFTDHTKATLFSGADDIGLTTFDVLYPLLHGFRDTFSLTLRSAGGETRTVSVAAVDETASLAARGQSQAMANFSDPGAVSWQRSGESAVLKVSTFVNYRTPVDADAVFGAVFSEIGASGATQLVLDMRKVGGGSTDVMESLLRHLIRQPITIGGPSRVRTHDFAQYREHLSTWNESALTVPASALTPESNGLFILSPEIDGGTDVLQPAPNAWQGPLTVLIGEGNESGLTILLAELRDEREALFIGQPTGGSAQGPTAGVIAFLTLPESQIVVRVPLRWNATSYQGFELGQGIAPDILVQETVADVRAGRDVTLERALQ
jgi:C-terminal processing protease CtpA/Prc